MSIPRSPEPAKLVVGVFTSQKALLGPVGRGLAERFGPVDLVSPWLSFDYTDYYVPEMGTPLFRRMFAFKALIDQVSLSDIKGATNAIEALYTKDARRRVNVDPGYLLQSRFVLATGKNFAHRIYVGGGIYADLTLIYSRGRFESLPWTYPDYADERMHAYLGKVRSKYVADLRGAATTDRVDADLSADTGAPDRKQEF